MIRICMWEMYHASRRKTMNGGGGGGGMVCVSDASCEPRHLRTGTHADMCTTTAQPSVTKAFFGPICSKSPYANTARLAASCRVPRARYTLTLTHHTDALHRHTQYTYRLTLITHTHVQLRGHTHTQRDVWSSIGLKKIISMDSKRSSPWTL